MAYVQGHFFNYNSPMQVSIEHMSPIQFPILIYIYIYIYKTENHINLFLNMLFIEPIDVQTYELNDRNT